MAGPPLDKMTMPPNILEKKKDTPTMRLVGHFRKIITWPLINVFFFLLLYI